METSPIGLFLFFICRSLYSTTAISKLQDHFMMSSVKLSLTFVDLLCCCVLTDSGRSAEPRQEKSAESTPEPPTVAVTPLSPAPQQPVQEEPQPSTSSSTSHLYCHSPSVPSGPQGTTGTVQNPHGRGHDVQVVPMQFSVSCQIHTGLPYRCYLHHRVSPLCFWHSLCVSYSLISISFQYCTL